MEMSALGIDCANPEIGAKETLLRHALGDYSKPTDLDAYPGLRQRKPYRNRL